MSDMFEVGGLGTVIDESSSPAASSIPESPASSTPGAGASPGLPPNLANLGRKRKLDEVPPDILSKLADLGQGISQAKQVGVQGNSKTCKICHDPSEKKSLLCKVHKRAYEVIYRRVMKLKEENKEHPQVIAWNQIFGPDGDESLQSKVLLDFVIKNPDVKEGKRGKCRGAIELTAYVKSEGVRDSCEAVTQSPMLDWEIFAKKMENKRGWTAAKASAFACFGIEFFLVLLILAWRVAPCRLMVSGRP